MTMLLMFAEAAPVPPGEGAGGVPAGPIRHLIIGT